MNHASAWMMEGIIMNLPRERFHVVVFFVRDGNMQLPNDKTSNRIRSRADKVVEM